MWLVYHTALIYCGTKSVLSMYCFSCMCKFKNNASVAILVYLGFLYALFHWSHQISIFIIYRCAVCSQRDGSLWRHGMGMFPTLLCVRVSPMKFLIHCIGSVTHWCFFVVSLNNPTNKQSICCWFEKHWGPSDVNVMLTCRHWCFCFVFSKTDSLVVPVYISQNWCNLCDIKGV